MKGYVNPIKIDPYDLQYCVRRLPKALRALMKEQPIWVAGGYVRSIVANERPSDVDLFCSSKESARAFAMTLTGQNEKQLYETDNAITLRGFKPIIQFITRWSYEKFEQIFDSFDFTICQAGFYWDAETEMWIGMCSEYFYSDLAAKRLIYTEPLRNEDAGGSLLRVLKFYQRGYRIPLDSFSKVITRFVSGIRFDDRMIGSDGFIDAIQFKKVAKGLLYEVDPNIDPDHILEDLDPPSQIDVDA